MSLSSGWFIFPILFGSIVALALWILCAAIVSEVLRALFSRSRDLILRLFRR